MTNLVRALPVAARHRVKTAWASSLRQSGGLDILKKEGEKWILH